MPEHCEAHCIDGSVGSIREPQEDVIDEIYTSGESDFDRVIGCIEDIVIGDEFQNLQSSLMRRHRRHFRVTKSGDVENGLESTRVHMEYTAALEGLIEEELKKRIQGFDMKGFLEELSKQASSPEGEVFEMLSTLTDFAEFSEMMADFNRSITDAALEEESQGFNLVVVGTKL